MISLLPLCMSASHYGPEQPRIHTEVLSHSLARSLVPLHCSFVHLPHFAPLHSLISMLPHFAHYLALDTVNDYMAILSVLFSILDHSASLHPWSMFPLMVIDVYYDIHQSFKARSNPDDRRSLRMSGLTIVV